VDGRGDREPFTRRARYELLYCLIGLVIGQVSFAVIFAFNHPRDRCVLGSWWHDLRPAGAALRGDGRRPATGFELSSLGQALLGEPIVEQPPLPAGGSISNRVAARFRDGTSRRKVEP